MADAQDVHGIVFKNGTATCLARVVGADAANITQSDIDTVTYSIYMLNDQNADTRADVTGHTAVELVVADTIFDTLQTDDIWTVDDTGYNFKHEIDISENEAFAIAGREYLIEFSLTPTTGQLILVRFRTGAI